jgi:hypothetical protein
VQLRTLTFIIAVSAGMMSTVISAHASSEHHCVVNTSDVRVTCYGSFAVAVAEATGGRITDAPSHARKAALDPRLKAELDTLAAEADIGSARRASTVIEIGYEDEDFGGNSIIFTANRGCTGTLADIDFSAATVSSDIASYENFAGCYSKHYELANFQGRSSDWNGRGTLPFVPRSIQWS